MFLLHQDPLCPFSFKDKIILVCLSNKILKPIIQINLGYIYRFLKQMRLVKTNKKKVTQRKLGKEEILQTRYKKIIFPIKMTKTRIS